MPIAFTDQIRISHNKSVLRYSAVTANGEKAFAYIVCGPDKARLMFQDFDAGTKRAAVEYGEVIYSDTIPEPDEKAKAFLAKWLSENN